MQYVRNLSDSVSTAWNSINPATLSGAIDVIVVQHQDGSLSCSPFHVRFGKFSLLRPSDKKVEFTVNGVRQKYSMKLGEGGEAFFIVETTDTIPESLQTSPLVSPASSPPLDPQTPASDLRDPDLLELDGDAASPGHPLPPAEASHSDGEAMPITSHATSAALVKGRSASVWSSAATRPQSADALPGRPDDEAIETATDASVAERSHSPPPLPPTEAIERAITLSKELSAANIPSIVTETGDLMLDMANFKESEEDVLRAEILARKILAQELDGNYDIGVLFGFDEEGNLWIYSSQEAKKAAMNKTIESSLQAHRHSAAADAVSDPGYQSDGSDVAVAASTATAAAASAPSSPPHGGFVASHLAADSSSQIPVDPFQVEISIMNYAKTLRLTSDQLKELNLRPGENSMSFTVNRATCAASMYLWEEETPVVISDIDGTVTKSDALGHVLNMIGRDWTHAGIAKLYSDIALNGYNIMYLTSRSVGQADTTRAYLNGIVQDGYKMPHGPTILSPDRTMAALRREIYLRKPHVFKMATLRDIRQLYGPERTPFYAGFGNRLTDQISYRTVDVPRNRIFTINSNSEVSLDLLSLNSLKMTYVNINEVVDHYFPQVGTLIRGGGEEFTDFRYWRNEPLDLDEFSASDSIETNLPADRASIYSELDEEEDEVMEDDEEEDEDEVGDGLVDSYISHESLEVSFDGEAMTNSILEAVDGNGLGDDDEDEAAGYAYEVEEEEIVFSDDDDRQGRLAPKLATDEGRLLEKDTSAEVITGVRHLSREEREQQRPA